MTPRVDDLGWQLKHGFAAEGGFAMVVRAAGLRKRSTLRLLFARLER